MSPRPGLNKMRETQWPKLGYKALPWAEQGQPLGWLAMKTSSCELVGLAFHLSGNLIGSESRAGWNLQERADWPPFETGDPGGMKNRHPRRFRLEAWWEYQPWPMKHWSVWYYKCQGYFPSQAYQGIAWGWLVNQASQVAPVLHERHTCVGGNNILAVQG